MRRHLVLLSAAVFGFSALMPVPGLAGDYPKHPTSSQGTQVKQGSGSSYNPALFGAGYAIGSALGKAMKSNQNKPTRPGPPPNPRTWRPIKDLPLNQRLSLIEEGIKNSMSITDYHTKFPFKTHERGCDTNSTIRSQRIADYFKYNRHILGNYGANIGIESQELHTHSVVEIIDQSNDPVASYNVDDYSPVSIPPYKPSISIRPSASIDWAYYDPKDHVNGYTLQHKIPPGQPPPPPIDFSTPAPAVPSPSTTSVPRTPPAGVTSPAPNPWRGHSNKQVR